MSCKPLVIHRLALALACFMLLGLPHSLTADDAPDQDSQPLATQPTDAPENYPRVYGDFAKITLTPEQREAIHKIQRESKDKIAKLEAQADADARLLLDEDQLKRLAEIDNERRIKAKKAYEARKQKEKADLEELARRRKREKDME